MSFLKRIIGGGKERGGGMLIPETPILGQRTLFVPYSSRAPRQEIIDEFQLQGYAITKKLPFYDGAFPGREQDLGFWLDEELRDPDRNEVLAKRARLEQPKRLAFPEVYNSDKPVVVKFGQADGGQAVFLLNNKPNLVKFLAFANDHFGNFDDIRESQENKRQEAFRALEQKDWDWKGFADFDPGDHWIFQEYIDTPSKFHTSYRIVADGYGNIHYGTLLRSADEKMTRPITTRDLDSHDKSFNKLFDPKSIYCLTSPSIVSNAYQGGIMIHLNGQKVIDRTNRQVLMAHDIDPDNPQIPERVGNQASKVGVAFKGYFPYTGADFIDNIDLNSYFLEGNLSPFLFAGGMGITREEIESNRGQEHEQEYLGRVLARRIAKMGPMD